MQELARQRGGECLSKVYEAAQVNLLWKCSQGHTWQATYNNVKRGTWCAACAGRKKGTLEECQTLAEEKGGACLSETYINGTTKMRWKCAEGHTWETSQKFIKRGSWCPTCAGKTPPTIEELKTS